MMMANSAYMLDKDSYFFKRTTPTLGPPPFAAMRGLNSVRNTVPKSTSGLFSKLSLGKEKETELRVLPELNLIRSLDQSRWCSGKSYFCLSIWRSNRMTILGCPDDTILDGITSAITVCIIPPLSEPAICCTDPVPVMARGRRVSNVNR